MQLNNQDLIKKWESLRLKAYLPTPDDKWTIGWGHTHSAYKGMKITEERAQELFNIDIIWAQDAITHFVKVKLNQNQFDALVSFVFNVGETNFKRSTLLKKLNKGNYQGAADELLRWNKQTNKKTGKLEVLNGLTKRRKEEREYFLREIPTIPTAKQNKLRDRVKNVLKKLLPKRKDQCS